MIFFAITFLHSTQPDRRGSLEIQAGISQIGFVLHHDQSDIGVCVRVLFEHLFDWNCSKHISVQDQKRLIAEHLGCFFHGSRSSQNFRLIRIFDIHS